MRCKDQVVIVTGSGKGIGKGIAVEFAKEGASVIVATRGEQDGKNTVKEIESFGGKAQLVTLDVRSEDSVRALMDGVADTYGRIDVLVNNAGITLFKSILDADLDDWERVVNTNLRGYFLCSKYAARHMVKRNKGVILNISSNHAYATLPDTEIYAATKGGINAMTRSMALSLRPRGIRVNAICPGFTRTPHYDRWLQSNPQADLVEEEIAWLHAGGRIGTPEDIGKLAVFLASDDAEMINGSDILIDGGLTARLYHSRIC